MTDDNLTVSRVGDNATNSEPFPSTLQCGEWSEVAGSVQVCAFWMEGVMLTVTGFVGLIGNALSVAVLSKANMYNAFNQLLTTLSILDSIFIILAIVDYAFVRAFSWQSVVYLYLFPWFIYPLNNMSFCASIFITVAMAFERYTAVCRPLHYRDVTTRHSVRRRTLSYVIPAILASILLNVPKFLESTIDWVPKAGNASSLNDTSSGSSNASDPEYVLTLHASALRNNPDFIRYYIHWMQLLCTGLLPMAALVFFNCNIFLGIRRSHVRMRSKKHNRQKATELNLAAVLLGVVFLFLVCHCPRLLLNVLEFFMLEDIIQCGKYFVPPKWFFCFTSFNHWLLIVNSSFNFLIYCSIGASFKAVIKPFLPEWCCRHHAGQGQNSDEYERDMETVVPTNMQTMRLQQGSPAAGQPPVPVSASNGAQNGFEEAPEAAPLADHNQNDLSAPAVAGAEAAAAAPVVDSQDEVALVSGERDQEARDGEAAEKDPSSA